MELTPRFEPQQGAYSSSTSYTSAEAQDAGDVKKHIAALEANTREGQTVTYSLADGVAEATGAVIVTKGSAKMLNLGTDGTAIPSADLPEGVESGTVGTVVLNVTVSQNGYTSTVYTVTVTRTYYVLSDEEA